MISFMLQSKVVVALLLLSYHVCEQTKQQIIISFFVADKKLKI